MSFEARSAKHAFEDAAAKVPDRQTMEPLKGDAGKGAFERATGIMKEAAKEATPSHFEKATQILKTAAAEAGDKDLAARISEAVKNGDMEEAARLMAEKAESEAKKE